MPHHETFSQFGSFIWRREYSKHAGRNEMRLTVAILVCIIILYGMDAYWFEGFYLVQLARLISEIHTHI
jgi:hypothetical protein